MAKGISQVSGQNMIEFGLIQLNPVVGQIQENVRSVKAHVEHAEAESQLPLVLVFPELVVTGYPPEDLLLRDDFLQEVHAGLDELRVFTSAFPDLLLIVGVPLQQGFKLMNSVVALCASQIIATHHKVELPNYLVFDEMRYFAEGHLPVNVFEWHGCRFALSVCEDIWFDRVMGSAADQKAQIMLNVNASPFHVRKQAERIGVLKSRVAEARDKGQPMSIVYVNQVGGQDELVFDGGSMVMTQTGEQLCQLPRFQSQTGFVQFDVDQGLWLSETQRLLSSPEATPMASIALAHRISTEQSLSSGHHSDDQHEVFQALVLGTADYVRKNGFKRVVLGLSGGIDSALTMAIAVAALGPEAVTAVMMPFDYTSPLSLELAQTQAETLGVHFHIRPIAEIYNAVCHVLAPLFEGHAEDVTEENIQARCRGIILMAMSNKFQSLVLTTGNKSELAVGYSTLYGDMAGGYNPIKDIPKTQVYALSEYLNRHGKALGFELNGVNDVIPQGVITRAPSAELRPNQTDQDSLPEYNVLDAILYRFIELDQSAQQIMAAGFAEKDVFDVIRRVRLNEHKRRQAPLGARLTAKAFGRDRRFPVTSKWS